MKIEFRNSQRFLGVVTSSELLLTDYTLLSFILLLKVCDFNGKMSLRLE